MAELKDNSARVRREITQRLARGLNKANTFLIDEARGGAPVGETGALRDGIEVLQEAAPDNLVAAGASKAPHSHIVNRGTSRTEANPFWTSAWLRMKNGFPGFFKA